MLSSEQIMTTTANGAISHPRTGSACLDYFSKCLARSKASATPDEEIKRIASAAWDESPLDLMRLLAHKRDCRGGAGERHVSKVTWRWLVEEHYSTALLNLRHVPFYGRWKDLVDYFMNTAAENAALELFSTQLSTDIETLNRVHQELELSENATRELQKTLGTISLAAKWAPTEGGSRDRLTKCSHKLASILRTKMGLGEEPSHSKLMKWYRTSVISPLRDSIGVVERLMCLQKWTEIDFSKVPSKALLLYSKKCFPAHAAERFAQWQQDVLAGRAKMNASQVDPYEVVHQLIHNPSPAALPTLEAFYQKQVEELRSKGDLGDSLVMADVSGSMAGTPMTVSVSMAIWMSALASAPFRDVFLTFESTPRFVDLSACSTLQEKVNCTLRAPWGGSTDLQAAFELLLSRAIEKRVSSDEMPKKLFIVSDMQFDVAGGGNLFTNYETIVAKYRASGYTIPEIVFWNVSGIINDTPVTRDTRGVAMISGFSKSLIGMFLTGKPIPSPYEVMRLAIDNERYARMTI